MRAHMFAWARAHASHMHHTMNVQDLIRDIREAGSRIRLINDGDVAGAIETAKAGAPVDIMLGVGGTPGTCRCMGYVVLV